MLHKCHIKVKYFRQLAVISLVMILHNNGYDNSMILAIYIYIYRERIYYSNGMIIPH